MTKTEQARVVAWRLKILRYSQEEPRRVARTCRHFGISRTLFYRWKRRFEAHGEAGLADRARTPRRSPRATPPAVVSKILYLRQEYHFGPGRIADYLKRFHQVPIACSTVHRILIKHRNGISDDIHLFNEKLREWEDYYNYHRPHGALEGQTPFEGLMAKTRADVSPGS